MAQFLGDIAFLLEMVLVAGGLVLLHRSRQEAAGPLRAAAPLPLLAEQELQGRITSCAFARLRT